MQPLFVILDNNTLSGIALRSMLSEIVPFAEIHVFGTFDSFSKRSGLAPIVHYFVSADILISHAHYFKEVRNRVIALAGSVTDAWTLSGYRSLDITQPEAGIVKALLRIHGHAHPHGHVPPGKASESASTLLSDPDHNPTRVLTPREKEVLGRVVKGFINKEIAEQLHISITTVISHRKNVCQKLGFKSIGRLTLYAVLNQIVDIGEL